MTDEEQILGLVRTYTDAWDRGDADAFASVFSEDADFRSIRLDLAFSRREIAEGHRGLFASVYMGTRLKAEVTRIRFVRPDVAVFDVDARIFNPEGGAAQAYRVDGPSDGGFRAHAMAVAERRFGEWKIASFMNMVPFGAPLPKGP